MLLEDQASRFCLSLRVVQLGKRHFEELLHEVHRLKNIINVLKNLVVKLLEPGFDIVQLDRLNREVGLEATLFVVQLRLLHLRLLVQLPNSFGALVVASE